MDITLHPVSGATQTFQPPVVKTTADPAPTGAQQTPSVPQPAHPQAPAPASSADAQYEAAARQAALSFKDVYALGDQQFSIFKDAAGKYITRYVSLRDGKVTYLPEPTFVRQLQIGAGGPGRLAISA